jgi:NADPH:quinone reductase-like Zn-dependent oxidoreductase
MSLSGRFRGHSIKLCMGATICRTFRWAGFGVAGVVRAVGDGVDRSWIGRRVVSHTERGGGYAEQAVLCAERMIANPASPSACSKFAAHNDL